jgi:nitroimidazol reductase NimA-like FMN-containing flavoprotein (pyridoxamine 5'-phosphate oxidase superfamily)
MSDNEQLKQMLSTLLATQLQAVLATQGQQQPYTSLMAFTATTDLKRLLFATYRNTFKYQNLLTHPRVAMLIDNRTGHLQDHYGGIAVTATGNAQEVEPREKANGLSLYLAKHPNLADFVLSPACALMAMEVEHYYVVSDFQTVTDLPMK